MGGSSMTMCCADQQKGLPGVKDVVGSNGAIRMLTEENQVLSWNTSLCPESEPCCLARVVTL